MSLQVMATLRSQTIRLAHLNADLRPHLLPLIREAKNPGVLKSVMDEIHHLLSPSTFGGGEELTEIVERLKGDKPLSVEEVEDAVEMAERRLDDASDRDHYRKVLRAIKKLRP